MKKRESKSGDGTREKRKSRQYVQRVGRRQREGKGGEETKKKRSCRSAKGTREEERKSRQVHKADEQERAGKGKIPKCRKREWPGDGEA